MWQPGCAGEPASVSAGVLTLSPHPPTHPPSAPQAEFDHVKKGLAADEEARAVEEVRLCFLHAAARCCLHECSAAPAAGRLLAGSHRHALPRLINHSLNLHRRTPCFTGAKKDT